MAHEHHCDGVWIDLDAVLDAAGEGQPTRPRASRRASARPGSSASDALGRTRSPSPWAPFSAGSPRSTFAWDLALVGDRSQLEEASAWSARSGGQLVLSEEASLRRPRGTRPSRCSRGRHRDLVRGRGGRSPWSSFAPPMAGRDSTLASSSPPRTAPAQAPWRDRFRSLHPAPRHGAARAPSAPTWREPTMPSGSSHGGWRRPCSRMPERRPGAARDGTRSGRDRGRIRSDGMLPGEKILELRRQLIELDARSASRRPPRLSTRPSEARPSRRGSGIAERR